jgi:hypothetical protein
MLLFRTVSARHSGRDSQINSGFIRLLASESARLGADPPLILTLDEDGPSVGERYAPMCRLVSQDDELFLLRQGFPKEATRLRHEHRRCYFAYVTRLTREIRAARKLQALAMASRENWSFWTLLEHAVLSESSLLYLRWLGYRHAVGVRVTACDVKECLDFLFVGPKLQLAAT